MKGSIEGNAYPLRPRAAVPDENRRRDADRCGHREDDVKTLRIVLADWSVATGERPVSVTFHRAFDMTPERLIALETLIELGVNRILTSGQEPTAYEGADRIAELIKASVDRLIVLPGGGITSRNVARVAAITGASEIHFAARVPTANAMRYRRGDMYMGGELRPPEYDRLDTTAAAVGAVINAATRVR